MDMPQPKDPAALYKTLVSVGLSIYVGALLNMYYSDVNSDRNITGITNDEDNKRINGQIPQQHHQQQRGQQYQHPPPPQQQQQQRQHQDQNQQQHPDNHNHRKQFRNLLCVNWLPCAQGSQLHLHQLHQRSAPLGGCGRDPQEDLLPQRHGEAFDHLLKSRYCRDSR